MLKRLLFLVAMLPMLVQAQATTPQFVVTWTPPTTNTDGTLITLPISYQLYTGPAGKEVKTGNPVTAPPYVVNNPAPLPGQTLCATITATVNGQTSVQTAEACGTIPFATPNPPTTVIITIK